MSIGKPGLRISLAYKATDIVSLDEIRNRWSNPVVAVKNHSEAETLQRAVSDIHKLCDAVDILRMECAENVIADEKKDRIIQVKYFNRRQDAFGITVSAEQSANEFLATIPAEDIVDVGTDGASWYAVYRKEKV